MMNSAAQPARNVDTGYPLSTQLNIKFSPYEDRLVFKSKSGQDEAMVMLLSRRMVMIVLQQLLVQLPRLSGLDKTPAQYWQEVLRMSHQQAMQSKAQGSKAAKTAPPASADMPDDPKAQGPRSIFLATEFTVQRERKRLILAFRGLPMPKAMTVATAPEPVFAMPLQLEHVHQLIELLITKSQEAHWHLPVDLPWLENPKARSTSLGTPSLH